MRTLSAEDEATLRAIAERHGYFAARGPHAPALPRAYTHTEADHAPPAVLLRLRCPLWLRASDPRRRTGHGLPRSAPCRGTPP